MANNSYQADRALDGRSARPEVVITTIVLLALLIVGAFIFYDLRSSGGLVVDNSLNQAVLSETVGASKGQTFVEPDFSVTVPEGWKRVNNPEIIVDGGRYYPVRFQGVDRMENGRKLDIYIDKIPGTLPVNKIIGVEVVENEIVPGEFSNYCADLFDVPDGTYSSNHYITWNDYSFMCKPSKASNAIAAITTSTEAGLKFTKDSGESLRILLVWQDHSMRINDSIFTEILKSFKLR